jgi:hypothetical protein
MMYSLKRLKKRSILLLQQPLRNVNAKIRIDPDKMCVECGVVDLGQG